MAEYGQIVHELRAVKRTRDVTQSKRKWIQSSIHREALVSKSMPCDWPNVLSIVVKIAHLIKWRSLYSCFFEKLCEETRSNHKVTDLKEIRNYLPRGKGLTWHVVELRDEVGIISGNKNELEKMLRYLKLALKLMIFECKLFKLNELNLYLQGMGGTDIL